jgi:drug/metabolite transporter (DMT)-like permease
MVLSSGVLFAINGTASKLIIRAGVNAQQLTTLRATATALALLVICLIVRRRQLRVYRREVPLLLAYGLIGFFAVPALYFSAIARLPVGIALLLQYTAPLMVALWVRFGQRQPVRRRLWVGLALSLLGLALVAQAFGGGLRLDPLGVTFALTAAALFAMFYLLGASAVARREALTLTFWGFAVAALAGLAIRPIWAFPFTVLGGDQRGWPVWSLALYLVVGGSIVAYGLVNAALAHLPPTSVGIIAMIEPVVASAVAWVVLDERLGAGQLIGGGLVLVGVALAETARPTVRARLGDTTPAGPPAVPPV